MAEIAEIAWRAVCRLDLVEDLLICNRTGRRHPPGIHPWVPQHLALPTHVPSISRTEI